jgi:hypothetical protein
MVSINRDVLEERILDFEDAVTAAGTEFYGIGPLFGDIARRWLQKQTGESVELLAIALAIETWLRDDFAKLVEQYASREKYAGFLEGKVNTLVHVARNRFITAEEAWVEGKDFYFAIYGEHHELIRTLMKESSDEEIMKSIQETATEYTLNRRQIRVRENKAKGAL